MGVVMSTDMQPFKFWCQKVIPLVYDDSLSYYELLCKVVKYINDMISTNNAFGKELEAQGQDIAVLQEQMTFVLSEFEKVKNGDYVSLYLEALASWVDENLKELVARIVKFVSFGLTQEGYFIANIPETWDFLEFETGFDPKIPCAFMHLIIRW